MLCNAKPLLAQWHGPENVETVFILLDPVVATTPAKFGQTILLESSQLLEASFKMWWPCNPLMGQIIGVKSITVNNKKLNINSTLLKINSKGYGGTKISSVNPYTVMESSIYAAVKSAFRKEMSRFHTVTPVAPFKLCYNSTHIKYNQHGPDVPWINLVLRSRRVYWRIYGSNSMVQVRKDVLCLGFIDGGLSFQTSTESMSIGLQTSIVLGGHQLENNLLQFDMAASKLGFSSSLLQHQTTCSGFNFTSTA